jgi:hypothetical protein
VLKATKRQADESSGIYLIEDKELLREEQTNFEVDLAFHTQRFDVFEVQKACHSC